MINPEINPEVKKALEHLSPLLHGKDEALLKILICIFSSGHILLEDLPGLGKTTMVVALSKLLGLNFGRIQCTNDLLPTDVTGLNIFKSETGTFEFHPGPVFNNLVLVDEINRATPKTQSALLEAMGEEQVTIDGVTYKLEMPFFVVATQNPAEHSGTFPLPESQLDRFMMRLSIGYPPREAERVILKYGSQKAKLEELGPMFDAQKITQIQKDIKHGINVSDKIFDYVLSICEKTRSHPDIAVGISTRGAMMLIKASKTFAWMHSRDYVIPEDLKAIAQEILLHRIMFRAEANKKDIFNSIFMSTRLFL